MLQTVVYSSSMELHLPEKPGALNVFMYLLANETALRKFLTPNKCESWKATIPFCISFPQSSSKNMKVYFDPVKYTTVTEDNDLDFVTLREDLEDLAMADVFYLKSSGGSKFCKTCLFCCKCNHACTPTSDEERVPFRISSLHYDLLNSRGCDG